MSYDYPKVKVLQKSTSPYSDKPLITVELEYPRFIHSEFMTHGRLSKNSASSRAIPVLSVVEHIKEHPAIPAYWGLKQKGMSASSEHPDTDKCEESWLRLRDKVLDHVQEEFVGELNLQKQIANRPLEPFQIIKVVCTATEWNNFFWLRSDKDAQPEIRLLSDRIKEAIDSYPSMEICEGEYHVPYVDRKRDDSGVLRYYEQGTDRELSAQEALEVSASCCAQVSYRKLDTSKEKKDSIYDSFINTDKVHASPFEHQGTPVDSLRFEPKDLHWMFDSEPSLEGVTHIDNKLRLCSNNFIDWKQHRAWIPNNYKE